jgi:hypothetical protein
MLEGGVLNFLDEGEGILKNKDIAYHPPPPSPSLY